MKLVSYLKQGQDQLALFVDGNLYDMDTLHPDLPISMAMFLNYWEDFLPVARSAEQKIKAGLVRSVLSVPFGQAEFLAPVPHPGSYRQGAAFRQHILAIKRSLQAGLAASYDDYPPLYQGNHNSIQGPGELLVMPDHLQRLDFGVEAAIVIGKSGRNIKAADADEYIAGLMILNAFCSRTVEMEEMTMNLGLAKGRDFALVTGPMLVTLDELQEQETACKENHQGKSWNLGMRARVNGALVSESNLSDMDWTFAELIERSSYGVYLYPGDIIGSGTAAGGSFLDLNEKTGQEQWLKEGDQVELEIDGLGKLENTLARDEDDFSLLALKDRFRAGE
jgi:fumarylacetoacetate (FAA) hydrolase